LRAVRRIQFCCGHRVLNHESKCANPHGHNYVALFHAEYEKKQDELGRVVDFSVLKEKIGGWIDENWDHTFVLSSEDKDLIISLTKYHKKKIFVLQSNPTAENMAEYLLKCICPQVLTGTGVKIVKVVLWETENCYAEVSTK